jgi:hypothetical protein
MGWFLQGDEPNQILKSKSSSLAQKRKLGEPALKSSDVILIFSVYHLLMRLETWWGLIPPRSDTYAFALAKACLEGPTLG